MLTAAVSAPEAQASTRGEASPWVRCCPITSRARRASTCASPRWRRSSITGRAAGVSTTSRTGRRRWAGKLSRSRSIDEDQGRSGASSEGRDGFKRLVFGGGSGRGRRGVRAGGESAGAVVRRLVPAAGDRGRHTDADRRRGGGLRPQPLQRPAAAGPQGNAVRGGAALPQAAHGGRSAQQGASGGVSHPAARGLRVGGGGIRSGSGRAGTRSDHALLRELRASGDGAWQWRATSRTAASHSRVATAGAAWTWYPPGGDSPSRERWRF